jgi:6-phosphogluconolactonase
MASRLFRPFVSLIGLLVLAGCGGGSSSIVPSQPTPSAKPAFLYVRTLAGAPPSESFNVAAFKLDPSTGTLTATATIPITQLAFGFTVDPTGKFLYISDLGVPGGVINIFSIDPNSGAPNQKGQFNPTTVICSFGCPPPVNGPGPLAMDPTGKFLFYGSSTFGVTNQVVGSLAVDSTGNLTATPGSPFPADYMPVKVAVHPTGKFVYTENIASSIIFGNTTGGTDPQPPLFELKNISGFSVAANGVLAPIPGSPFVPPPGSSFADLVFHPSGKFVYLTNSGSSNILGWSVDNTTGALTTLPGTPVSPGTLFGTGVIHPNGKFLYLPSIIGGITGFSIDANTGALAQLSGSPFAVDQRYISLVIDPTGQSLFVGDFTHNTLVEYKIDATTGALTISGSATPVGGQPESIAIVKAP